MTTTPPSTATNEIPWPWSLWPLLSSSAKDTLVQPINPGWTFGNFIVDEQNSTAPDTERDIVAKQSYGRQLGKIMDALAVLIARQPETVRRNPALQAFNELRQEIEQIKSQSAARRLDRIVSDLAELKKTDPAKYESVASELRVALGT